MPHGIFYIGAHKTGSSALQEYLTLNSHKLLENGVLYPFVEPDGIAYAFAKSALNQNQTKLSFKIKSPQNHIAYKMLAEHTDYKVPARYRPLPSSTMMMQTVRAMMQATQSHTLLLCSELFIQFGTRAPQAIKQLLESSGVKQFSAYAVLRRPDLYLASWQSQLLKAGASKGRLSDDTIKRFIGTCHLEYTASVTPWVSRVGPENFNLVNYAELKDHGGSIGHFTRHYGLHISNSVTADGRNTGLPYAVYETIRQANAVLGNKKSYFIRWCIDNAHNLDLPVNSEVELFGQENRSWLVSRFRSENRDLGKLTGTELFFPDLDAALETNSIPELEASKIGFASIRATYLKQPALQQHSVISDWLQQKTSLDI